MFELLFHVKLVYQILTTGSSRATCLLSMRSRSFFFLRPLRVNVRHVPETTQSNTMPQISAMTHVIAESRKDTMSEKCCVCRNNNGDGRREEYRQWYGVLYGVLTAAAAVQGRHTRTNK